jgi:1,4-alpha-glucan branching enzyme
MLDDAALPSLQVEVASGLLVCRWDKAEMRARVNFSDEDLVLRVFTLDKSQARLLGEFQVNFLSARQLDVAPGSYRLDLVRASRPEVVIHSRLEPVPALSWLQEGPASQVVLWGELNWDEIEKEVVQTHGVSWDEETRVCLKVDWLGEQDQVTTSWIPVHEKDHATLHGRVRGLELAVLAVEGNRVLKTLLRAERRPRQLLETLLSATAEAPGPAEKLMLWRETVETDTVQLRAIWRVETKNARDKELRLVLEHDGVETLHDPNRTVALEGEFYFHGLEAGRYVAKLYKARAKTAFLQSAVVEVREFHNNLTLMPVNAELAFVYWHVGPDTWRDLAAEQGDLMGRIRCFLKVYQEYAGQWYLKAELSPEINLNNTRDYYLNLPQDRVYRTQVVALIDEHLEIPLTDYSNSCQLARTGPGTNPVAHKWQPQHLEHPTIRDLRSPQGTSNYSIGYLMLHLHAHLPFIADPVQFTSGSGWRPAGYPQEWFAEAVRETYLPLLDLCETLVDEGVDFKFSMDISPPLVAMLRSQRHAADVLEYLDRQLQLAHLEVERTAREERQFVPAARMHLHHLIRSRELYLSYGGDLVAAFRKFQDLGYIEISTCIGTHPMLPLWTSVPSAMRGQALAAAEYHLESFGRPSVGVWLPECAYTPGIESVLEEAGFRYFFSETATVTHADSNVEFGVNAPVYIRGANLAVFARDPETSGQVWSGEEGYPGDPDYLEFHMRGGPFKYNRITDRKSDWKQPYNPDWAERKAASHAGHFVYSRNARFEHLRKVMWKKPLIVASYDAELFGHHWYEGPRFLYYMFKKLHFDQNQTELITPSGYLAVNPTLQDVYPAVSSWGAKGTFEKWMFGDVSWMYRHVHEAAKEMRRLVHVGTDNEHLYRVLQQAARQLMLAMSSDLPFVISNGHFVDRMKEEFFGALRHFWKLSEMHGRALDGSPIDFDYLRSLELKNCLFPNLRPEVFG